MQGKLTALFDEPHDIAGWVGMLLILGAYTGVSLELLAVDVVLYQMANGVGALLLIYATYKTKTYPVMVLNIIWVLVAAAALARILL